MQLRTRAQTYRLAREGTALRSTRAAASSSTGKTSAQASRSTTLSRGMCDRIATPSWRSQLWVAVRQRAEEDGMGKAYS